MGGPSEARTRPLGGRAAQFAKVGTAQLANIVRFPLISNPHVFCTWVWPGHMLTLLETKHSICWSVHIEEKEQKASLYLHCQCVSQPPRKLQRLSRSRLPRLKRVHRDRGGEFVGSLLRRVLQEERYCHYRRQRPRPTGQWGGGRSDGGTRKTSEPTTSHWSPPGGVYWAYAVLPCSEVLRTIWHGR